MASHTRPKVSAVPRTLLRAGLIITAAAGAALGATGAASADEAAGLDLGRVSSQALLGGVEHGLAGGVGPIKHLQIYPLARTGVDPLDNVVGTQIADFKPISTGPVTAPLTNGGALADLPLIGPVASLLPG
ncbi:hypothetical protein [Streptomyces sp. H27-D2]|uniref:hypothetical protein n=1 Tax=Streptomyces sp. H27-D2 TaxID=3046304 RepID=UPI002DB73A14|nr:hypothetical protein [Streptomyces sp. H27-D2]MEC4019532.1 hypothetical protein [Streptomyces sp. H27-D2]